MPELFELKSGQDTPLMRQYLDIKSQCKDAILLYRLGDFYEMFFEDAVVASKVLDIALTSRDKQAANPIPLCGVPHHSSRGYISKLLDAGHKVAICEQMEEAGIGKGIVKREIVKVISSGTRSDEEGLLAHQSNLILSLFAKSNTFAISWIDVSNGAVESATVPTLQEAKNLILTLSPAEIIVPNDETSSQAFSFLETEAMFEKFPVELVFPWVYESAEKNILKRFHVNHAEALGLENMNGAFESIFGLLYYIEEKNLTKIPHVQLPKRHVSDEYVYLDYVTQENLELFESRKSSLPHSNLFSVLNQTMTGMGSRELFARIKKPLRTLERINERLGFVDFFVTRKPFRDEIRGLLGKTTDIERILRRVAIRNANVADLISLRITLEKIPVLRNAIASQHEKRFQDIWNRLNPHVELCALLSNALDDVSSVNISEGGFIRKNFNAELDRLRSLSYENQQWLAELETKEKRRTGISSLKISYNRVFGYYIEITKVHHDKVPADYIRKQTLVSSERYITPELKEKENEIQSAKEKMIEMELQILQQLRNEAADHVTTLQTLAQAIAELDVHAALAHAAVQFNYRKPTLHDGFSIQIQNGRHPMVERNLSGDRFVPNDLVLQEDARMILLTGPNMAGKSTIMRQAALIVLMGQMGSYVPADQANMGIVDRIFTRIGANDDLSGGRSTFMVEMNETAQILLNATDRSLILLDEIGRGTSTYDGLSIAWAVAEDIDQRIKAKTIFATHYHELTKLTDTRPHIRNMRMSIREWNDQIVFLRKVEPGITERSYGIEVAQLAGVRKTVISRAKEILKDLENGSEQHQSPKPNATSPTIDIPWIHEFQNVNIDDLTPKQALDFLYHLKKQT